MKHQHNRRDFLKNVLGVGAGAALGMPMLTTSAYANAFVDTSGYKALVAINLAGGNDGTNTVVPLANGDWQAYHDLRPGIALSQSELKGITPQGMVADAYGLHPSLDKVQTLFAEQKAAIVANVGTLIDGNGNIGTPPKRASHNNQSRYWQGEDPTKSATEKLGWVGRLLDNEALLGNSAYSVDGKNIWQTGKQGSSTPYIMNEEGPIEFLQHADSSLMNAFDTIAGQADRQNNRLMREINRYRNASRDNAAFVRGEIYSSSVNTQIDTLTIALPQTALGQRLEVVLRSLLAHNGLGSSRNTFYVKQGGYDTHNNQLTRHTNLLKELNDALFAFQRGLEQYGLQDQVTTFTMSEFGRTTTANATGTDHGWGGHQFILGGAVNGGSIYGQMPEMDLSSDDLVGDRGVLKPSTSVEEFAGTLMSWFGVSDENMAQVVPHIDQFRSVDDPSSYNLGFMQTV